MIEPNPKPQTAQAQTPEVLVLDRVMKRNGRKVILKGVNLTMRAGEVLTIIGGATGAKAQLTRLLNGQLNPDGGSILRAGPPGPNLSMPMGFNMGGSVIRGLELRAASYGLELGPYINAVGALLPDPNALRSALTDLSPTERLTVLYGSALLLPCTHFINDSGPLPADKRAKRVLRPLFREARKRAAFVCLNKRMNVKETFPNQRFMRLHAGELFTLEDFEEISGLAGSEKADNPQKAA